MAPPMTVTLRNGEKYTVDVPTACALSLHLASAQHIRADLPELEHTHTHTHTPQHKRHQTYVPRRCNVRPQISMVRGSNMMQPASTGNPHRVRARVLLPHASLPLILLLGQHLSHPHHSPQLVLVVTCVLSRVHLLLASLVHDVHK